MKSRFVIVFVLSIIFGSFVLSNTSSGKIVFCVGEFINPYICKYRYRNYDSISIYAPALMTKLIIEECGRDSFVYYMLKDFEKNRFPEVGISKKGNSYYYFGERFMQPGSRVLNPRKATSYEERLWKITLLKKIMKKLVLNEDTTILFVPFYYGSRAYLYGDIIKNNEIPYKLSWEEFDKSQLHIELSNYFVDICYDDILREHDCESIQNSPDPIVCSLMPEMYYRHLYRLARRTYINKCNELGIVPFPYREDKEMTDDDAYMIFDILLECIDNILNQDIKPIIILPFEYKADTLSE